MNGIRRAAGALALVVLLSGCSTEPRIPGPEGLRIQVDGQRCPPSVAGAQGVHSPHPANGAITTSEVGNPSFADFRVVAAHVTAGR